LLQSGKKGCLLNVTITDDAIKAIETILRRGNDAVVYRNKDGVVVAEQTRKITYRTAQRSERGQGN
jgi:hypothetical protein